MKLWRLDKYICIRLFYLPTKRFFRQRSKGIIRSRRHRRSRRTKKVLEYNISDVQTNFSSNCIGCLHNGIRRIHVGVPYLSGPQNVDNNGLALRFSGTLFSRAWHVYGIICSGFSSDPAGVPNLSKNNNARHSHSNHEIKKGNILCLHNNYIIDFCLKKIV